MSSRLTGSARLKVMHVTLRPCSDINVSDVHNDPNIDNIDISVGVGLL